MRAYFLLAGVLGASSQLHDAWRLGLHWLPVSWTLAIWPPLLARLALSVGFVAAGIKLKAALPIGAGWIKQLLLGAIVVHVVTVVLLCTVLPDLPTSAMTFALVAVAISAYLLANVRRLAAEAIARAVPPARIV